jgi:hypothetical protein
LRTNIDRSEIIDTKHSRVTAIEAEVRMRGRGINNG